jgi:hypothetical protein
MILARLARMTREYNVRVGALAIKSMMAIRSLGTMSPEQKGSTDGYAGTYNLSIAAMVEE